jgi:tripartite-type tricarboxylate transporter receptor subunit TctC
MRKTEKVLLILLVIFMIGGTLFAGGQKQTADGGWKPNKPIHIIVPWGAGGSTDQITRVTAAELEKELGVRIVIDNQPGASGSTGTKNALDAPKDGYTWTAGAAVDLATYKINGMLDTNIKDNWDIFLTIGNVGVIGVNADSKYQTFDQLLADFKANPGQIGVATAGQTSSGHVNIELIRKYTGIDYKHVTYDGGNPAVTAVVAGEVLVTSQLAVEEAAMIRGKKIRPLAVLSEKDMELSGYGTIPSITKWIPEFKIGLNYFGIFIPKGVPQEVIAALTKVWNEKISNSEAVKKYAADNGAVFDPSAGQAAQDKALSYYQPVAWLYYEGGKAKIAPDTAGIPRP